jgi:hypothetical protein
MQQNSVEQVDPVQQDTLVYADIGPASFKKRGTTKPTFSPDDTDDRVEYALLNHNLPIIKTNKDSIAGNLKIFCV